MGEFIGLVFTIWLVWYLLEILIDGNNSHTSKVDSRSKNVDYRDYGPYGTRKRQSASSESISNEKTDYSDFAVHYNNP